MSAVPARARRLPLVLRNRSFGKVWAGQLLTQAAIRMFQVGAVWWIVSLAGGAHRGLASGVFLMVSTVPAVAFAPVVARVVARHDHRTVLAVAAAVAGAVAVTAAALAALGALPVAAAYLVALVLAGCQAVFDPCLTTSVPELVEDCDIESATGCELATQSVAGLVGGLLGPLVVEAGRLAELTAASGLAYLLAAGLIVSARFARTGVIRQVPDGSVPGRRTLRQVLAGRPFVRRVLVCFAAANFFTTAIYVVMPLYTRTELHAAGSTVALLEAALGAGALVGSFTGGRLPGPPVAVASVCLAVVAAALALPGVFAWHATAFVTMTVVGWCVGVIGVRFIALFQRLLPADDKPGFFAVMQAMLGATFPVSSLVFGALGDHLTARTLCLIQGAGVVPVAAALWWLGGRHEAVEQPTPTAPTSAPAKEPS
ncbi:MFS transporter [Streptomyces sp. NPDC058251]|uniref:MFS transporter n=1 Tax=unclassified Streptomyces TaxID=2593676 RepID=UPI0036EAD191